MNAGIVVADWNDAVGLNILTEYPNNFRNDAKIDDNRLLHIFNERIVQAQPGLDLLESEEYNIASYYSPFWKAEYDDDDDREHGIVFLFLPKDVKIESIKEQVIEFSLFILKLVNNKDFPELFLNIIDNFSFLEPISEEQRYAAIYNNEMRERLLESLGERPRSKSELDNWLKEEYQLDSFDIQGLLNPFLKTGIIRQSLESPGRGKYKEIIYYLIKDVYLFRVPPRKVMDLIKKGKYELDDIVADLEDEVRSFFEEYELTRTEIRKISVLLSIPNTYKIIALLRESPYIFDELRGDFLDKYNYLPSNFMYLLKLLEKNDIIKIYKKSGGKKFIVLKSDIQFHLFFPEYLVDKIRQAWREGSIDKHVAIKHLTMLRDEYMENFMSFNGTQNKHQKTMVKASPPSIEAGDDPDGLEKKARLNVAKKMEGVFSRLFA
nr:hypothetical protein [Candidatus Sigynarchaeota archaeon]